VLPPDDEPELLFVEEEFVLGVVLPEELLLLLKISLRMLPELLPLLELLFRGALYVLLVFVELLPVPINLGLE
jgi:hypothetical protein